MFYYASDQHLKSHRSSSGSAARWWVALCVGLLLVGFSRRAAAQEGGVVLLQQGCPVTWEAPLRKLVLLELRSLVEERPRAKLSDIRRVEVTCSADRVVITVVSTRGRNFRRSLSQPSDDADSEQPRIVALTTAELADSIWFLPPTSPKEARSRPYRRIDATGRRWMLLVGGGVEVLGRPSLLGLGAQVSLEHTLMPLLAARFESRATFAGAELQGTDVRTRSISGHLSALLGNHVWERSQRWSWGLGPGVRVGWAQIIGIPQEAPGSCAPSGCDLVGEALDGLWFGPTLSGRLALILPEAVVFSLSVEGGLVTRSVVGIGYGDRALFGYDGPWLGGGLSIGSAF